LTLIESGAFYESSLQSIIIPRNVRILGSKCFSFCESLSSITFDSNSGLPPPVGLKIIPEEAFRDSGLIFIVIPATVRVLEKRAFYCCHSFTELQWAEGIQIEVIEEEAFESTKLKKLMIPGSLQYIGARMCPSKTELLLMIESKTSKFETWKRSFMQNRSEVMGRELEEEKEKDGEVRVFRMGFTSPCC
jgi:hypothetical protein